MLKGAIPRRRIRQHEYDTIYTLENRDGHEIRDSVYNQKRTAKDAHMKRRQLINLHDEKALTGLPNHGPEIVIKSLSLYR